jgi:hypothetical protein
MSNGKEQTKVVNLKKSKYDTYIGRPEGNVFFHYGNPFSHNPNSKAVIILKTRKESIEAFSKWLNGEDYCDVEPERRKWILEHIHELKGKTIGCFCCPQDCHGMIYLDFIQKIFGGTRTGKFILIHEEKSKVISTQMELFDLKIV